MGLRTRPPAAPAEPTVAINAVGRRNFRRRRFRAGLRRWRTLLITVLVLLVAGLGTWLLYFSDHLVADRVEVAGASSVSAQRVETVARVPLGTQLARVDVDVIRARVESIAAIGSAEVSRSWPATLSIEVTERQPVAAVERGGRTLTVDLDGVLFPGRPADLPRIRTSVEVDVEALAQGARVAAALPGELRSRVRWIDLKSIDEISLHLRDGRRVVWGTAVASEEKAEVALALLERDVRVVDVTVPGRPTTR